MIILRSTSKDNVHIKLVHSEKMNTYAVTACIYLPTNCFTKKLSFSAHANEQEADAKYFELCVEYGATP